MKIIADIGVKLNNYDSLYHAIWGFLNRKQGEDEPNKSFKLRFENFYNTMEITGGYKNPALKYSSRMGDRNQWSKTSTNWPDQGNVFSLQCGPEEVQFPIQEA